MNLDNNRIVQATADFLVIIAREGGKFTRERIIKNKIEDFFICDNKICFIKDRSVKFLNQSLQPSSGEKITNIDFFCSVSEKRFATMSKNTLIIYENFKAFHKIAGINSGEKFFSGGDHSLYPNVTGFKLCQIENSLILVLCFEEGLKVYISQSGKTITFKKVESDCLHNFSIGKKFTKMYHENNQIFAISERFCLVMTLRNSQLLFHELPIKGIRSFSSLDPPVKPKTP